MSSEPSSAAALLDIAVLVFREGLECVLVLAAITAGRYGTMKTMRRPVGLGVLAGFAATMVTWWIAVGFINDLSASVSALTLQAATGLLAILVLLVVMNWFFHKLYWTGWISMHSRRRDRLVNAGVDSRGVWLGLVFLGFTSLYREGFEVVLFLQSYRLRLGSHLVGEGALLGLGLTLAVAVLAFVAHQRLPYKRMLVVTGVMLGVVLLVMVGEQAQEMQLAGWLPTHTLPALAARLPGWLGTWLSVFPTMETLVAQGLAAVLVLGSFWLAGRSPAKAAAAHPAAAGVKRPVTTTR